MSPVSRKALAVAPLLAVLVLTGCSTQLFPTPRSTASPQSARGSEPVRVLRGPEGSTTVLVPVVINGKGPYTFALDTGASTSLVDTAVANQAGLQQVGRAQTIQGVGGVERAIPVRPTTWSTGPIKLPVLTISAAALPSGRRGGGLQGLLGSDVLSVLGRFTLDYRSETLTVGE